MRPWNILDDQRETFSVRYRLVVVGLTVLLMLSVIDERHGLGVNVLLGIGALGIAVFIGNLLFKKE